MKRDWECIRAILVALEEKGNATDEMRPNVVSDFDAETVSYNMKLLLDAKLIEGPPSKPNYAVARAMTWEGHELLDKIRAEPIWNRIKALARERGLPLSFQVVTSLAVHAITHYIGP